MNRSDEEYCAEYTAEDYERAVTDSRTLLPQSKPLQVGAAMLSLGAQLTKLANEIIDEGLAEWRVTHPELVAQTLRVSMLRRVVRAPLDYAELRRGLSNTVLPYLDAVLAVLEGASDVARTAGRPNPDGGPGFAAAETN